MRVRVCESVHVRVHVCVCVHMCMCVNMCVCVHVCTCVYERRCIINMDAYTHTFTHMLNTQISLLARFLGCALY